MKKLLLIVIGIVLFANSYKSYKIIELINEIEHKKTKFLPLIDYNVFPINIDNKLKIQQYIKEQSSTIDLRAIVSKKAYINNKWYKKGDKMQNLLIDKVTNNCVFFVSEDINKTFNVCLSPDLIKVEK